MGKKWNVSPKGARVIREQLRNKVKITNLNKPVTTIAGIDVSLTRNDPWLYAGIMVFSYPNLDLVEEKFAKCKMSFPYIPGLLSFREIPCILEAWNQLLLQPDVAMVDGHGIAHPRRLGIATHFGIVTSTPTIGVAKTLLFGVFPEIAAEKGEYVKLVDPKTKEMLGYVIRTKDKVKPVFVSAGHLISHEQAREILLSTLRGYRLPEPTRLAHIKVNEYRKKEEKTPA